MKYIIIGAVAGGASAAARLRRIDESAEIVVFEKGDYISYANCGLPYYIGDVITDRNKLFVQTAASFHRRFAIDVRVTTEVTEIDAAAKTVTARNLRTGQVFQEAYDKLLLAPGAQPVRPPLRGIELDGIFTLRNVSDTDHIKAFAAQKQSGHAVIVGAGFIGLEMAENLHRLGMSVTIVEMGNQILAPLDFPMAAMVQQHLRAKGIHLKLGMGVSGFSKTDDGLNVHLASGISIPANIVILSIGVRPDTRLAAAAGLELGPARGISVNAFLQTSNPDIYAVGDAVEFANPITGHPTNTYLAGPANKQGRISADNMVFGNVKEYGGSINTAIVQVFDLTVGVVGIAAKNAAALGIAHVTAITHSGSHAGYYPNAQQLSISIVFDPTNRRLMGAQVVGRDGADKRLDVLAMVIRNKGTIDDLAAFEHAYAPPYSSAKDPVNMAGFVAENMLAGLLHVVPWDITAGITADDMLIDVRNPEEFATGSIPGAVNIPVDDLRQNLKHLPMDKRLIIFCQVGLRGYLAQRILVQHGFKSVHNISGGYTVWQACEAETSLLAS